MRSLSSETGGMPVEGPRTKRLCEYLASAGLREVPEDVTLKAKWLILDNLGNAIAGGAMKPSRIIEGLVKRWGGSREATVLSSGFMAPLPNAVYANAYNANALDFDDTYASQGHAGSMVIPAALSVCEYLDKSGEQFLAAVIHGYEAGLRVGRYMKASPERYKQVMGQASYLTFASVAAASKAMGLNAGSTMDAFGIAGASAPVPFVRKFGLDVEEKPVSWVKNNFGWASMAGVMAASLAADGFVGNRSILDGEHGFWIMAGSDRCDFELLTEGLGEKYLLVDSEFKPYASCRWSHSALDAAEHILEREGKIDPSKVDRIEVRGHYEAGHSLNAPNPDNVIDAQFSLQYLLALSLVGRSAKAGLNEKDLEDQTVRQLMAKVAIEVDDEYSRMFFEDRLTPYTVTIVMKDGRSLSETVYSPSGSAEYPMSDAEVEDKFLRLASPVVGESVARRIVIDVFEVEKVPSIRSLVGTWFGRW